MTVRGFDLQGKKALVMGAGNSVGVAISLALAEAGADLVLASCTTGSQEQAAVDSCTQQVAAMGRSQGSLVVDATSPTDVEEKVGQAVSRLGRIDILVNNMELAFARPLVETGLDEWSQVLSSNLTALFLTMKSVGRHMLERGSGRVVNVASQLGDRGLPNASAYCAAKGGTIQLTKAAALEWAPQGVYVNAIGVGWTKGDPLAQENDPQLFDRLTRILPLHRLARSDEVGALAVFLASDDCSYITGHTVFVDGGVMCRL